MSPSPALEPTPGWRGSAQEGARGCLLNSCTGAASRPSGPSGFPWRLSPPCSQPREFGGARARTPRGTAAVGPPRRRAALVQTRPEAALGPGFSRRRRTVVGPSAGRGRGSSGGGSVSPEPDRAGPSRRQSRAGRDGGAMWFMYVLSWLSLFIQVSFITLAVGESAQPRSERAPTPASVLAWVRTTRVPERPGDSCPALLAFASPPSYPTWSCPTF